MDKKYFVHACPNCVHYKKKFGEAGTCELHQERMITWFNRYGMKGQKNWNESMNLDCYEESTKMKEINKAKADVADFFSNFGKPKKP